MVMTDDERRERHRQADKRWRNKNAERRRKQHAEAQRRYVANNPEKAQESSRKYRANNKEKISAKNRKYFRTRYHSDPDFRKHRAALQRARRARGIALVEDHSDEIRVAHLLKNNAYAAAEKAVPQRFAPDTRLDIIGDIILDVYEGVISVTDIPAKATEYSARHFRSFSRYDFLPLEDVEYRLCSMETNHG